MAGADIGRTCVDVFPIDFIREQIKVIFLHEVADLVHLAPCIEVSGRVVGVANHNGTSVLIDQFLKLFNFRQGETLIDSRCNRADSGTCTDSKCHVVGIGWLWNDNLVSRVQTTHESKQHGLATTRSDDDVVGFNVDVVFSVVACQLFPIAQIALTWRVFQQFAVNFLQCVESALGCWKVGLTDVEMIYLRATFLCCCRKRCQLSDRRLWHF